jgi:hypothetical protein
MTRGTAKRLLILAASLLVAVILCPRYTEARLSCHKCRALRDISQRSILGITLSTSMSPEKTATEQPSCAHDWWQYSRYYQQGLFGLLSKGVACNSSQYKDGWRPKG